jgi:SAM-dependent methyltransferase
VVDVSTGYQFKLFAGDKPEVSTFAFHQHRDRAPHLEQSAHRPRLEAAARAVRLAVISHRDRVPDAPMRVVDLGCGDGGLLSLIQGIDGIDAVGYDFQPSNAAGWAERSVRAVQADLIEVLYELAGVQIVVMTEVLEHLARPHLVLRRVHELGAQIVCSSPWTETAESHDACHAWAWDQGGYEYLLRDAGFSVASKEIVGMFQVLRGVPW